MGGHKTGNNENLKTNFSGELNKMSSFLDIAFQEKLSPAPYKRKYTYSNKLDYLYNKEDFN